jgi:ABC-type glycerol-3-phosphate transport system substrate-binding protein
VGGGGDFEVAESIRLALAAGGEGLPDMVQLNYTQVPEFAAAGETLDLGPSFEPYEQDMYAGALELSKYDNRYVCYPYEIKSKLFYYRDDMFGEAGISLDDMNTVDGFIAAGQAFNNQFPDSYVLNLGPEPVQYWIGELVSPDPEARMADVDGKYYVTEKKAFADAFKFLKDIYVAGITFPIDDWSSDWQQAFADEAICGFMCASWVKFFLPSFAPAQSGQWTVDLWPKLEPMADQRYGSEAGGAVYIVPKQSQHPELAAETLAKTFLDKEGAIAAYEATGMTPLMKSAHDEFLEKAANPERTEGMSDEDWAAHPANFFGPGYFEAELASYDYVKVFPYDPSAAAEIDILRNWLIRYMADEVELEDALAGAQADMESQIGNPYDV